tara:strand:+ start:144 stop:692 length:549 start_codon:yes stop_codon:yes gene_type:complete
MSGVGNVLNIVKASVNTLVRILPISLYLGSAMFALGFGDFKALLLFFGLILNDLISLGYQSAFRVIRNPQCAFLKSSNDSTFMMSPHTQFIGFAFAFMLRNLYYTDDYFPYKALGLSVVLFLTIWSRVNIGCLKIADSIYTAMIGLFLGYVYFEVVKPYVVNEEDNSEKEENNEREHDIFSI